MNDLEILLRREIASRGAISFRRFMELSLYAPGLGFYERAGNLPGKESHFYTSVSVGPLFARMLAWKFGKWLETVHSGSICEAGAGQGTFAHDLLSWMARECPDQFARLHYRIIEPSAALRSLQQQTLQSFAGQVSWADSWKAVDPFAGIIFSNELLDSFPVRRLVWRQRDRQWLEAGVTVKGDQFGWTLLEERVEDLELSLEIERVLPDQFTVDLNPGAAVWWREAAHKLSTGWLVTFDYGPRGPWLDPQKPEGTLRGFFRQHQVTDLLSHPGEIDLTSDVHFDELREAGEQSGLETDCLMSQGSFFHRLAEELMMAGEFQLNEVEKRQFQTLTHPEFFGRRFQVLVQRKTGEESVSGPLPSRIRERGEG